MIRRLVLAILAAALPVVAVVASSALPSAAPSAGAATDPPAYWLVASDGGIFAFGGAPYYGSTGGMVLNRPVVGIASTRGGGGYWEVASDGGIFSYGNATFYGSTGSMVLNKPVVGMASDGSSGYWLVASDGGIFSYGDAHFYGSTGAMRLNQPVVGMAATPDGKGYWLVASDGGIFSYGDAQFYGSTGSMHLNQPIIGMIAGPGGNGYSLIAADGGMFSYGATNFFGSLGGVPLKHPIVGAATTPTDDGYWMTDGTGLVTNFGSAQYFGSAPSPLFRPIVGMAEAPGTGGFFGGSYPSGAYGYDISKFQCGNFPTGAHTIGIVQVDGATSAAANPCLAGEAAWAGDGLNLYIFLNYEASTSNEPGCNSDQACNAGYQAGIHAFKTLSMLALMLRSRGGSMSRTMGSRRGLRALRRMRTSSKGRLMPSMRLRESPTWASTRLPSTGMGSLEITPPDVPLWMASWTGSGPASCAQYAGFASTQHLPTGPLEIVQYDSPSIDSSVFYDEDYAC